MRLASVERKNELIGYNVDMDREIKEQNLVLSIIVPIYNEEKTIIQLLDKVQRVDLGEIEKEIIIVDDHSMDYTNKLAKEYVASHRNVSLIVQDNGLKGKGSAIKTGLKHATGQIIIIQDADLEYEPEDYPALIEPLLKGEAQVVYGSRSIMKSNVKHAGFIFFLGGIFLTKLANFLYNIKITDEPTCYKVFDSQVLRSLDLKCKRFEFCPEVTAKIAKKKIKIQEVPIRYYPRSVKQGKKIEWRDGLEAIWTLLKYRVID